MSARNGFTEADVPDQSGKGFIVTGANTGLGLETSRVLAARGARVLLACRDRSKAEAAMAHIRQTHPGADLAFLPLDLADLASVRAAAGQAMTAPRIDALINNAGVMMPPLMRTTQGFELQLGVNHLGGFALTALLLPKLAQTPGSRVVVTSSLAHRGASINWDDLSAATRYNRVKRYGASKLANALFFFELDRRLRASGSPSPRSAAIRGRRRPTWCAIWERFSYCSRWSGASSTPLRWARGPRCKRPPGRCNPAATTARRACAESAAPRAGPPGPRRRKTRCLHSGSGMCRSP